MESHSLHACVDAAMFMTRGCQLHKRTSTNVVSGPPTGSKQHRRLHTVRGVGRQLGGGGHLAVINCPLLAAGANALAIPLHSSASGQWFHGRLADMPQT